MHKCSFIMCLPILTIACAPKLTPQVFTSGAAGFYTHSIWVDDGQEVTVVDTQFTPEIAQQLIEEIQHQTSSPITRVIITHPNPDKFNGLSAFHPLGAESITSTKIAAAIPEVDAYKKYYWTEIAQTFTEENYPTLEAVKSTFTDEMIIPLKSGETLTLIELLHPGVSSHQLVVRVDKTGDLIVGDLVHHQTHAWLEGGIIDGNPQPNLDGWKKDLEQLELLGTGKVYGGRGDPVPVSQAIDEQILYLEQAEAIVESYLQDVNPIDFQDSIKAQEHYLKLQDEFAKAFPDYAHPELIGYGIYGLVQSKISPP